MTILFTTDNDGIDIEKDAALMRFENEADALAFAREFYAGSDFEVTGLEIGHTGDCWCKWHNSTVPTDDLERLARENNLSVDELSLNYPGTHPGGRAVWINPKFDIYVALIREIESE